MKDIRLDGLGIFLLGLAALVAISAAIVSGMKPSVITLGCDGDCLAREDLGAQINMAWAAWVMVIVTAVSVIVGALSLVLIAATLRAAQSSARAAEDTADSAARSLEMAETTLNATRSMGIWQSKAYITVASVEVLFQPEQGMLTVYFTVKNSGATPAVKISAILNAQIEGRNTGDDLFDRYEVGQRSVVCPDIASKDEDVRDALFFRPIPGRYRQMYDETGQIWNTIVITGQLNYQDVFGQQNVYEFAFEGFVVVGNRFNLHRSTSHTFVDGGPF